LTGSKFARANGESTYALLNDWIKPGKSLPKAEALTELAERYLRRNLEQPRRVDHHPYLRAQAARMFWARD